MQPLNPSAQASDALQQQWQAQVTFYQTESAHIPAGLTLSVQDSTRLLQLACWPENSPTTVKSKALSLRTPALRQPTLCSSNSRCSSPSIRLVPRSN
jgi:hypothetical protein